MIGLTDDPVRSELDELAPALRRRDPDALARTYELTADLLASIALGLLGDRHAAEDTVQEAFLRLVSAAPDIRGDGRSIRAWLVRTTRNVATDRLRKHANRFEAPTDTLPDTPAPGVDPADALPDPELVAALTALTEDQRTALVLRYVGGFSGHELGLALGRNRAAAYTLLRRAERALQRQLRVPVRSEPSRPSPTVTDESRP